MQVSSGHLCASVCVCLCPCPCTISLVPSTAKTHTRHNRATLMSLSDWTFMPSYPLESRTHSVNNTFRFICLSGSDTDPRLSLQIYQRSSISSQDFINNKDNNQYRALKASLSNREMHFHNHNMKRSWSDCENEQHVMQVTSPAGAGVRDEGRSQKVKS